MARAAFTIIVDTREQTPYTFEGIRDRHARSGRGAPEATVEVNTVSRKLNVGDYGLLVDVPVPAKRGSSSSGPGGEPWEPSIVVERKSLIDLYGTLGRGRDRFLREVERAEKLHYQLHLVIESDLAGIMRPPMQVESVTARTVTGTLASWSIRYPWLHVWTPGPRRAAEIWTYRLLEFAAEHCAAEVWGETQ